MNKQYLSNQFGEISLVGSESILWNYKTRPKDTKIEIAPPVIEINGERLVISLSDIREFILPRVLANGAVESVFIGDVDKIPGFRLQLTFRVIPTNPVIRFKYELVSSQSVLLTKINGRDSLDYFRFSTESLKTCREIRLSEFDESVHSFRLTEREILDSAFENSLGIMGPILVASGNGETVLAAYEHGSQAPDAFVHFQTAPDRSVTVRAVKGNYYANRVVDGDHPFETLWFQLAAIEGAPEDLAPLYRSFVLQHFTMNPTSRKPWIFYNTWNFQERNKFWNGKNCLDPINDERMLAEIDVAHKMGIDVFVIDTGWYQKTGDWEVDNKRFASNLSALKKRLDIYGMKLGLWFSPVEAAVTSRALAHFPSDRMSLAGKLNGPHPVWETEESYRMCLVSTFWERFADELIRLTREVGVVYFKWDAVDQYGCDDPRHHHGAETVPATDRADNYAFEQIRYMQLVIEKLCRACPEAIVDFDITEGWRSVGLAFLASGKYFLINNGPYFGSLDFPPNYFAPNEPWSNVLVFPGPSRPRLCRAALDFDRWIPSILFLTHYLPDDPESSQLINIASLILGQNGIWGDLLTVSKEGVERFGKLLGLYKQVRDDITESYPVRSGIIGGSPEVHEKINTKNGRGVICLFSDARGFYTYISLQRVAKTYWAEGVKVTHLEDGTVRLDFEAKEPSAKIVFFGVE